jgi:protocatechuate 3,4-dioxygenase beta subunit
VIQGDFMNLTAPSKRRSFLKLSAASLLIAPVAKAAAICVGVTPEQTEGPFYPVQDQNDKDWDLVRVKGQTRDAQGDVIFVRGQILDENCVPVSAALVEIWQACNSGRYNHPNDPNQAPLDPLFQYWGRAITNAQGKYEFRTIIPGAYPADETWWRPPHIHYKVHKRGYMELTTQLYFEGHKLNAQDKILQKLSSSDQAKVVRPVAQVGADRVMGFDLTIRKV